MVVVWTMPVLSVECIRWQWSGYKISVRPCLCACLECLPLEPATLPAVCSAKMPRYVSLSMCMESCLLSRVTVTAAWTSAWHCILTCCLCTWMNALMLWRTVAHCCHMVRAIKHPVPGWASECPDVKNYKCLLNLVWHRMLYSCTHMATVGINVSLHATFKTLLVCLISYVSPHLAHSWPRWLPTLNSSQFCVRLMTDLSRCSFHWPFVVPVSRSSYLFTYWGWSWSLSVSHSQLRGGGSVSWPRSPPGRTICIEGRLNWRS